MLGGTHHVGRAVVEEALARGDQVTTLTRGVSGPSARGALALHADRTDPAALRAALGNASWDAVVDTWSGAPRVVLDAAALLADRAGHYGYVSSRSVYSWPIAVGLDESGPVVAADPASEDTADYAAAKRGGELAALQGFGANTVLARAGPDTRAIRASRPDALVAAPDGARRRCPRAGASRFGAAVHRLP